MEKKILAVVDGREITSEHLAFLVQTIGNERAKQFQSEEGQSQLLQELINQELFYSYALEKGLEKHEAYVQEVEIVQANLLKSYAVRRFLEEVVVDATAAQTFYQENPEQFQKPETVKASHILVATLEEATAVKASIEAGLTFEEAATLNSSCPSKERGGDLGQFGRGQMVPEFEKAAFELEVGAISEPVQTQFGFHLIRVDGQQPAETLEFEAVKDQIERHLTQQTQNQAYFAQIDALKNQYTVTIAE